MRPAPKKRALLLAAAALVVPASLTALGCAAEEKAPQSALEYAENARAKYEQGVRALEAENWEGATEVFNELKKKYGYSRYARLAELRLADADLSQDKFAEAVSGYKSFVHDYPNDPEVPYARYRVAKAQYESVSMSVLMPPLEERDLAAVNDALVSIRQFLADFPATAYSDELRYMRAVVVGLLARHELYVARFYLGRGKFDAAIARCEHALDAFDNSGLEPEALVLLGETYMKSKEREKARAVFERVIKKYPASPFIEPARRFLAVLGPAPANTAPPADATRAD
ncbi:MAG TPA: outer membrane protein assembly factor BamD [Polyangiaceae bacterium]|nr:outer membrane protein assembly factor BamD [Polyangiaceae bacterium]